MSTQRLSEAKREGEQSKTAKWGWGILIVLSAMLALNGVALYFISASPFTFLQNTGVPVDEVKEAFPTVAEHVVREGQGISIMLAGLGLMALVVALTGYRHRSRWAWNAMWVLVGTLAFSSVWAFGGGGRLDIGGFYAGLAAIGLVGQLLARRGLAAR
jgi:hypothetical protein